MTVAAQSAFGRVTIAMFSGLTSLPPLAGRVIRGAVLYLCLGYLFVSDALGVYGVTEPDSMRPLEGALASARCGIFYGVAMFGFSVLRRSVADEA
jgi:hypothetical protein